jgi:hypothetical protein
MTQANNPNSQQSTAERLRRWRLILGGGAADGIGGGCLSDRDLAMDGALGALYGNDDSPDGSQDRKGGLACIMHERENKQKIQMKMGR